MKKIKNFITILCGTVTVISTMMFLQSWIWLFLLGAARSGEGMVKVLTMAAVMVLVCVGAFGGACEAIRLCGENQMPKNKIVIVLSILEVLYAVLCIMFSVVLFKSEGIISGLMWIFSCLSAIVVTIKLAGSKNACSINKNKAEKVRGAFLSDDMNIWEDEKF